MRPHTPTLSLLCACMHKQTHTHWSEGKHTASLSYLAVGLGVGCVSMNRDNFAHVKITFKHIYYIKRSIQHSLLTPPPPPPPYLYTSIHGAQSAYTLTFTSVNLPCAKTVPLPRLAHDMNSDEGRLY